MGDYSYFGASTTYTTPYGNTYTSMTGNKDPAAQYGVFNTADTTYATYPGTAGAAVAAVNNASAYAAAAAASTPGTTYTSYTINPAATTANAGAASYNYVDWASAATAAAMSSAVASNRASPALNKNYNKPKQPWNYNRKSSSSMAANINKNPPKTYYCELCKVSCMGSLTYKEHCNGQKHKKKESMKDETKPPPKTYYSFGKLYRCELCDINCTGEQAFNAHMTGSKHNKTVLLFRKLGKTIPTPTVTNNKGEKEDVDLDQIKEELANRAERRAKEEADGIERKQKRTQQQEERAKKRLEDIESRKKMMDERRAKWEEERWKREEEWRNMQEEREEEWKQWQESEQCETTPAAVSAIAGFSAREGVNNDNKLIMQLHEKIYPAPAELSNIKNLVKLTEDNLKSISDTMRDETEAELKDKGLLKEELAEGEEKVETRVLKGCVRIGDLANGLLLKDDKALEMLVFCTDKPTVYMLQNVKAKFEELLTEAQKKVITVEMQQAKSSFVVSDPKGYNITITMTSKAMEEEITAASITADVAAKVLDRKNCMRVLEELKHSNWFQSNLSPTPSAVIALRIIHHILRREDKKQWTKVVKPWLLHVIIGHILQAHPGKRFSPGEIIRRLLETFSAGVFFASNGVVNDPCTDPAVDLVKNLPIADVEAVTADAQAGMRALIFNKLHTFLGCEPYVETEEEAQPQGAEAQEFEGYDGASGHGHPPPGPRIRMRGRPMRPPPQRFGPYGGPPPYGHGPPPYGYHHGPPPFPTHLGPRGPWRGPPPHMMRRGGPPPFGPRGFMPPRRRGPRPNNRKRKQDGGDTKENVKKECVEDVKAEEIKTEPETSDAAEAPMETEAS